jgi:hypothetical protein
MAAVIGTDGKIYTADLYGSAPYRGGGAGLMVAGNGVNVLYTITGDGMVWRSQEGGAWENQGFASRFIAVAGNLLVSIGTDGRC